MNAAVRVLSGAKLYVGGKHDWTSTRNAFRYGQYNVTRFLLDNGTNVIARDHAFWRPLDQKSRRIHVEVLARLLDYRA